MDLTEFLTACLNEDERDARATMETGETGVWAFVQARDGELKVVDGLGWTVADRLDGQPWPVGPHIARHDPARVLREVAAKRAILEDYTTTCRIRDEAAERIKEAQASGQYVAADYETWERANREASLLDGVVRHLLTIYADRPGFKEEWKPTEPAPTSGPAEYWATLRRHEQEARDPAAKDRHADMWKAPEEGGEG